MSEWFIRPDRSGQGAGVWSDGRLHDMQRGRDLQSARRIMQPYTGLCPHKLNPQTCLQCFHDKANAKPIHQPKPRPQQFQQPNAVLAAVNARAGLGSTGPVPAAPAGPVHVGKRPDGTDIVPMVPQPTRGPMPKPVMNPMMQAGQPPIVAREPFSYANESWMNQDLKFEGGKWVGQGAEPPQRRQVIDSLPSHPEAPPRRR